jgi:predicted nucleotidyltransferase
MLRLALDRTRISEFCLRWQIRELSLFGSILRDDFRADSDVDVLISFESDARWGLLDHAQMEGELADIIGRHVDLVTRRAVESSGNWIRRREILESAQTFYVAG